MTTRQVYDAIATLGWALLALGWLFHRDRRRHLALVLPGMAVDLALVLWLEATGKVIELTLAPEAHGRHYGLFQWCHIGTSSAAVVLYIPTIWLGARLAWGVPGPGTRLWHRRCAVTALALRTVGFGFMWTV